jgi:hypothetical protein
MIANESWGKTGAVYNENLPPSSFSSNAGGHVNVTVEVDSTTVLANDCALYGPL